MTDEEELVQHFINRSNWLRAAVLGANDGILSVASVVIGVAAASTEREPIVLAAVASLVAGALSMAAGEYVSVSSQTDIEKADIERERIELEEIPEIELRELAKIYMKRGLNEALAMEVAVGLTAHDALGTHVRDELGINEISQANPLQAALASGGAFLVGGSLPVIIALFVAVAYMEVYQYATAIFALVLLGGISAKTGGANPLNAILRITFWGTIAMGLTAIVGYFFGII